MNKLNYLLPDETAQLFEAIKKDKSKNASRNMSIFQIALYCGLRASEVGLIGVNDYDPHRKQIYCRRLKHSLSNMMRIIDQDVEEGLNAYYFERIFMPVDNRALFISAKGNPISRKQLDVLMKKYCQQTSIPKEKHHFHCLKHTCAVDLADYGVNVQDIQWWLGHKRIDNTLIYMQFTTKQQENLYRYLEMRKGESIIEQNKEKDTSHHRDVR